MYREPHNNGKNHLQAYFNIQWTIKCNSNIAKLCQGCDSYCMYWLTDFHYLMQDKKHSSIVTFNTKTLNWLYLLTTLTDRFLFLVTNWLYLLVSFAYCSFVEETSMALAM